MEGARCSEENVVNASVDSSNDLCIYRIKSLSVDEGYRRTIVGEISRLFQKWNVAPIHCSKNVREFVLLVDLPAVVHHVQFRWHAEIGCPDIWMQESVNKPALYLT